MVRLELKTKEARDMAALALHSARNMLRAKYAKGALPDTYGTFENARRFLNSTTRTDNPIAYDVKCAILRAQSF